MDDLPRRVGVLETKMDRVQDTLSAIQVTLAEIKATMVSKDDFYALDKRTAVLEERTLKLATTRGVAGMLTLATALLAILANWSHVIAYLAGHH